MIMRLKQGKSPQTARTFMTRNVNLERCLLSNVIQSPLSRSYGVLATGTSLTNPLPQVFRLSRLYEIWFTKPESHNYGGEDTRKNFVDFLYSSLVQRGIYTYKDDETLPRGESIGPSLFKAIEESRIAIIIFSENYADSSWCLDELAHIMKCRDERGLIVKPIFYHVNPSDVRNQNWKFVKHYWKNMSKARTWRKSLVDAANISGWVIKHTANGHESKSIKEIVDTVSNNLFSLIPNVNEDLIGIRIRLKELRSQLEVEQGGVRMIGIWGMGGGGKTTLASSVYDEIFGKFDGCCFLDNIRDKSNKYGLKILQENLLSDILKQKDLNIGRVEEGRRMIKSRLCHIKVLIVLDDVDHLDQLNMLAGSHDWFGEGSRIIITTRDVHLLNAHKVNVIYNVRLLNDDEAIKLFCKHAPREDCIPTEVYETLSNAVVSYAGGLPLALKVLGSFLCDKEMNEWMSALARLKDIPEHDIIGKLKISYDGLKPMEKELFLDIACFHRGRMIEEAMVSLDACGFHPIIGIKVLIQKALINVSNEPHLLRHSQGMFDMHDLIQEMGHHIARGEHPNNPEKHSRIWQEKDILSVCSMSTTTMNTDKVEALGLNITTSDCPQHLPHIVATMKNLRSIYWEFHPPSLLPTNFQPINLCSLILKNSMQIQLWEGYKNLPNLKVLDVSYSRNLIKTPDLEGLPCLERMILRNCLGLTEIHPSTVCHERLVFLDLDECENLEMFPPITRMPKLVTLILSLCSSLLKFPEIQTNMDSLVDISLRRSGIEVLPSLVKQYCTNLVCLDLTDCFKLKSIEVNFCHFKKLKELHLSGCIRLETPAQDFLNANCCLEVLSLQPMRPPPPLRKSYFVRKLITNEGLEDGFIRNFIEISYPKFPCFLTSLSLRSCNLVNEDFPSDLCELSNLQVLDLSENRFSRIQSNLVQLPSLKFLNISMCKSLVELPDLPSSIAVLDADWCDSLIIGDFSTTYKWLWKVSLGHKVCGGENVLRSMFQGNAIEDHFISYRRYESDISRGLGIDISARSFAKDTFTLQLPQDWYNTYSGFLVCVAWSEFSDVTISIKQDMHMDYQSRLLDEDGDTKIRSMCYIPFSSLMEKPLWNDNISFFILWCAFKVELVHRRSKGGLTEKSVDCSAFWDEQVKDRKTFTIQQASGTLIDIFWLH